LILGAGGFTGRHFVSYVTGSNLHKDFSFAGVDVHADQAEGFRIIHSDVSDFEKLEKIIIDETPHYIINFIGTFNPNEKSIMLQSNAEISRNIFEIIIRHKILIKKVLLIGSAAEYGVPTSLPIKENSSLNPVNFYGLSKEIQACFFRFYNNNHGIPANIARTFNIIGRGMSPALSIGSFIKQIQQAQDGDVIRVGNLNSKRDYLDIHDVISAYWKILLKGKPGEVYNVCSGKSVLMKDILDALIQASGKNIHIEINKELLKNADVNDIYGDNSSLKEIGWSEKIDFFENMNNYF
jgi:GDP-4-dehydro-6-deoxy-D-mannose reductase